MILGIGIDLIETRRVEDVFLKFKTKFVDRVLSPKEKLLFFLLSTEGKKVEFLAKRFSSKESFVKAVGIGLGRGLNMPDISIDHDKYGKPMVVVDPSKYEVIEDIFGKNIGDLNFLMTITDQSKVISTFAIIEEK